MSSRNWAVREIPVFLITTDMILRRDFLESTSLMYGTLSGTSSLTMIRPGLVSTMWVPASGFILSTGILTDILA